MLLAVLFVPYPSNFAGALRFLGLRSSVFGLRFLGSSFSSHLDLMLSSATSNDAARDRIRSFSF